jgi:hypothetical protein
MTRKTNNKKSNLENGKDRKCTSPQDWTKFIFVHKKINIISPFQLLGSTNNKFLCAIVPKLKFDTLRQGDLTFFII